MLKPHKCRSCYESTSQSLLPATRWEYEVREPTMKRTDRTKRFAGYGDNYSVKRAGYPIGGLPSEQAGAGKPSGKQTKGSTK